MTILLSDPRVLSVPVEEDDDPLVLLDARLGTDVLVRSALADRLYDAAAHLPAGIGLRVVEGHRSPADQQAIITAYSAEVCAHHPGISAGDLDVLVSRFVAPLAVAPHVAGAAVDLTLTSLDGDGHDLDLGTPIDATPERSGGRCYLAASDIAPAARRHRDVLARALRRVGLVNYPTEWWHWSYGDRYWALMAGEPAARYGPVVDTAALVSA